MAGLRWQPGLLHPTIAPFLGLPKIPPLSSGSLCWHFAGVEGRQLRGLKDPGAAPADATVPTRLLPEGVPHREAGNVRLPRSSASFRKRRNQGPERRMVGLRSYRGRRRSWRQSPSSLLTPDLWPWPSFLGSSESGRAPSSGPPRLGGPGPLLLLLPAPPVWAPGALLFPLDRNCTWSKSGGAGGCTEGVWA